MITTIINLLFGSTIKKAAAILISMALAVGAWQIHGCLKAKEQLRQYKAAEKIRQQDRKIDRQTEEQKNEIEGLNSDDELNAAFDRLRREAGKD